MVFIKVNDGENLEDALRRFKRSCERNKDFKEMKNRRHYLPPSAKKKLKRIEAQRKSRRRTRRH